MKKKSILPGSRGGFLNDIIFNIELGGVKCPAI
jgi:hypothetical protein